MKSENFKLYKASAGTGKTYTLVKEFLTLCLSSQNLIFDNILAVTFTNKAANEMKAKILDGLNEIMTDINNNKDLTNDLIKSTHLNDVELKRRATDLYDKILHNYSDLNVSTIDSFVQQISRTFANELKLPYQYRVLLDDDDFVDEVIQRIDKEIGDKENDLTKTLKEYIRFNLKEEYGWRLDYPIKEFVRKLLKESAYKKGESLNHKTLSIKDCEDLKKYLDEEIKKYKDDIKSKINAFKESEAKDLCYNAITTLVEKLEKDINISPKDIRSERIKNILKDGKWYTGKKVPSCSFDAKTFIEDIYRSHDSLYLYNIINKNLYLYVLRGYLFTIINQHIEETNKVHISEFNKRISDIIAECSVPFIYERIGSKFKHFFIDEFQDTSILQWFNFLPLIHNSLSDGNKNFLVGDAKQSIYRFRSGEVEQINQLPKIYNRPKEDGVFDDYERLFHDAIKTETLNTNYRTKKNIVYFNNSFFNFASGSLNLEHRKVYTQSMNQEYNEKKNEYDGCVNIKIYNYSEEDKKKDYKNAVMEAIVGDINYLKENKFKLSDITILVRSNSDGTEIAEYLSEKGIDVISSDSITLKSSDKVQLVINTLKYLMNENDNIAKLNLSFYQDINKNKDIYSEKDSAYNIKDTISTYNNFNEVNKTILELRDNALSLYDLCARIIKNYKFNIVEDVFLQYFMNMVQEWQNNENAGINAFLEHWDRKSDNIHVKISGKIDAVQIISIHKSKGLEYKVVMYPYVPTKLPEKFHSTEKWISVNNKDFNIPDKINNIIDDFMLPISSTLQYTDKHKYYEEELGKIAFDDINAMYVAMTRPKDVLYIYTDNKLNSDGDDKKNLFLDYDILNRHEKETDKVKMVKFNQIVKGEEESKFDEYQFGEIEYHSDKKEDKEDKEITLKEGCNRDTIDWFKILKFDSISSINSEDDDAKKTGILVHEIYSKIMTLADAEGVIQYYLDAGHIDQKRADFLLKKFQMIAMNPVIKDAYSEKAIIKNEMGILTKESLKRPDRYAELDDRIILIDYKTGKRYDQYDEQMKKYVDALKGMGIEKNIEAYLLYIGKEDEKVKVIPAK